MASYIKLHTEVVDGELKISSFKTSESVTNQYDLNIIMHALSRHEETGSGVFAYDFGMDF